MKRGSGENGLRDKFGHFHFNKIKNRILGTDARILELGV